MVVDQNGPQEIRYDMLRPIANDTDGPHYELIPHDGLSQSLALVPILERVQNDLPDAKIYWNQPENNTIEPLYGTLMKTKGELPRIELFNDQIDREALALQKYATIKNEKDQLDLARTLLMKSYDDLMKSIAPKRQDQNILQIYNEELLKQIAKDAEVENIQKNANKKIIIPTKEFISETERSSPQFEFRRVQRDFTKKEFILHRRNYYSLPTIELPTIELPTNTRSDQPLPQYMSSQAKETMPSIRNNLMHTQKKLPARESALALPKIRPTISENVKTLPRIELIETKTDFPVTLSKDVKNSLDKVMAVDVNRKITKNNKPFEDDSVHIPRNNFLEKINYNSQSASKYDKIVRQFDEYSKLPHHLRVPYGHDYVDKSSKSKKSLQTTMSHQNVFRLQNSDQKLEQNESEKLRIPLTDVVHIENTEDDFITKERPLENQLRYTANKKTDEKTLEETESYAGRTGEQPQFNDDSKLCRLKGGKLVCDVPMEPLVLKEPVPNAFLLKHQTNEEEERKSSARLKLTTKQRPSSSVTRYVKVKKSKSSDKEEMLNKYKIVNVKSTKKNIFKNNFNKKRKVAKNSDRWIADD